MKRVAERFCTTREAAELLGVSLKTVQLWSERGLLKAWRTEGGHRRILRESISGLISGDDAATFHAPMAAPRQRSRILVVEADDNTLRTYGAQLRRWRTDPEVRLMPDGSSALLEIGMWRPDLLITDLRMPDLDGVQMLQTLRRRVEFQAMPIVVVTGLDTAGLAARGGLPVGVQVFAKPVSFAELERHFEMLTCPAAASAAR